MDSKKYTLNQEDLKQIGIKLLMVVIAAFVPALIEQLKLIDFGNYQAYATGALFMLQYAGQRLLKGS